MTILRFAFIVVLILITAFFVAAEFSIVKVRKTRIDQLAEEGNKKAKAVQHILERLDGYLSACQLGITMTSLGIGWLGEPTFEAIIRPLFQSMSLHENVIGTLSFIVSFSLITFLNVVLGELAPKTIAIQKAEEITFSIAKPLIWFSKVTFPFIWLLNHSASLFTKMLGFKQASNEEIALSEEELRLILSKSYEGGEINQSEYQYVSKIFDFDNRTAKEIMVPRTEMVCLDKDDSIDKAMQVMKEERYTRYPVIDDDKDHILGLVHMKQFFQGDGIDKKEPIMKLVQPIIVVFESILIHDLLVQMQKERIHMAVLVDEYGGTAGLVTVEDIIEEIVGEIRDEYDADEQPKIRKVKPNEVILDGKVLISEVNDLFHLEIEHDEIDTIGGWILTHDVNVEEGTVIPFQLYRFKVLETDGHQVKKILVYKE